MAYKDKEQQREYQRRWYARRKAEFFEGKVCVMCGSTEELELDHVDPEQKVDHRIWSWSRERRESEIAKCQVLFYDCHIEKTIEFIQSKADGHGTHNKYVTGCRCRPCKDAHNLSTNEWRRSKKAIAA